MKIDEILYRIAEESGVSVRQVRRDIQAALDEGLRSTDPNVREYWQKIPHKREKPTLEEVIAFMASEAKRR